MQDPQNLLELILNLYCSLVVRDHASRPHKISLLIFLLTRITSKILLTKLGETVTILTCIWEISSSNFGWVNNILTVIHGFPQSLKEIVGTVSEIRPPTLPSPFFLINSYPIIDTVYFQLLILSINKV